MLQEAVHVEVGEQRADHAALRRAAAAAFATRHAPGPVAVTLLDRCLEPQLDQPQHVAVDDAPRHRPHQLLMRNRVEVLRQVGIHHLGVAAAEQRVHFLDRVRPAALRPIAVGRGVEIRLEDRLQHQLGGGLHHPVPDRRDAERPLAATGLRDHHPSHRRWPVRLHDEVLPDPGEPLLQPCRFDHREGDPVHARRALVGARQLVGVAQDVLAADLVVEQVEAERRLLLRLEIELPLKLPDTFRCCQAHRQSPILGFVESAPEVRALPSAGITRPHRYYDPVRLPPAAAVLRRRRGRDPHALAGLPSYPRHLSGVPCPLPRWTATGASVGCFPVPLRPSPNSGGSASTTSLSRPAQASLALRPAGSLNRPRRPLSRGFDPPGCPDKPLVSYQSQPTTLWVEPSSTGDRAPSGRTEFSGLIRRVALLPMPDCGGHWMLRLVTLFLPAPGSWPARPRSIRPASICVPPRSRS